MPLWVRAILRLLECVGLGLWISWMALVLSGGIYEVITGSPCDGFLFQMMFIGFPLFLFSVVLIPAACWRSRVVLLVARWLALFDLIALLVIRSMHP